MIGSTAARAHLPDWREPKDLDIFSPDQTTGTDAFWHPSFSVWIPERTDRFATLDELYTIKISHAYWELRNGSWAKHMADCVALKRAGASLGLELHQMLYKVWEERYGRKKVNLDMTKDDFFSDAVVRKFDHDSIHSSVAYGDEPMYVQTLKPGSTVAVDMAYIKAMPFEDQVKLYREEVMATALERILIPQDYKASPGWAYGWALRRTITSLTKGWSARFMADNFEHFRKPDPDYLERHLKNSDKLIPLERVNA